MRLFRAALVGGLTLGAPAAQACGLDLVVGLDRIGSVGGYHRLLVVVSVRGGSFQSNPGLQYVQVTAAGSPLARFDFHDVGAPLAYEVHVPIDDYITRAAAEIVFDPAGIDDGNPANNDCNRANDRASVRLN